MPASQWREAWGCFPLGPVDGGTTRIFCILALLGGPGHARGPLHGAPHRRRLGEARPHSGRRRRVSGLARTPHQMVAFPEHGTQRWLSEWLVSSQIGSEGIIMKNWQQLLE